MVHLWGSKGLLLKSSWFSKGMYNVRLWQCRRGEKRRMKGGSREWRLGGKAATVYFNL
jgi:hypothetical protein